MSKKTVAFTAIFAGSTGVFVGALGMLVALVSNKEIARVITEQLSRSIDTSLDHQEMKTMGFVALREYEPTTGKVLGTRFLKFTLRSEAEDVLVSLHQLLQQYQVVTMADLYALSGVQSTYIDTKWGWKSLDGAEVRRLPDGLGFGLVLPNTEQV